MTYTFGDGGTLGTGNTTDAGLADGNGNPFPGEQLVFNTINGGDPFARCGCGLDKTVWLSFLIDTPSSKLGRIRADILQFWG